MTTLADFNTGDTQMPQLSDMAGATPSPTLTPINDNTINNLAAHAALLSSNDQVVPTYSNVKTELKTNGQSPTLNKVVDQTAALKQASNENTMRSAIADPNTSTDEKVKLLQAYTSSNPTAISDSLSTSVATQAAISPSNPNKDNDETELARVNSVKLMDQVDAYNGYVGKISNTIKSSINSKPFVDNATDFIQTILPFVNQGVQAQISAGFRPNDQVGSIVQSFTLLGENRKALSDAFAAMPVDQRMEAAKKLVGIIQNSQNSLTTKPNDLLLLQSIQQSLVSGNYTGTDRFLDDLNSLADLSIIGAPVFKGAANAIGAIGKVLGGARKVADAADIVRANAAIDRLSATTDEAVQTAKASQVTSNAPIPTTTQISQSTADATRSIITDSVHQELTRLGYPYSDIEDVKKAVGDLVSPASIEGDETLSQRVTDTVKNVLDQSGSNIDDRDLASIKEMIDAKSTAIRRSVKSDVDPAAVSQAIKSSNPEKARYMAASVESDASGTIAEATHGTSREEAMAHDVTPEIAEEGGTVRSKPSVPDSIPEPDQSFIDWVKKGQGMSEFSAAEKDAMRNVAKSNWDNVTGLVARREMNQIGDLSVERNAPIELNKIPSSKIPPGEHALTSEDLAHINSFNTPDGAQKLVDEISINSKSALRRVLAIRISPFLKNVRLDTTGKMIKLWVKNDPRALQTSAAYFRHPSGAEAIGFNKDLSLIHTKEEFERILLHEGIHAATVSQIEKGMEEAANGLKTPLAKASNDLINLRDDIRRFLDSERGKDFGVLKDFYAVDNPKEIITFGLTNPYYQQMLKQVEVAPKQSAWNSFVSIVRLALHLGPEQENGLTRVIDISDRLMSEPKSLKGSATEGVFTHTLPPDNKNTERGVSFDQVFGPEDSGFVNARDGANQIKFALRKYGITDQNVEMLGRDVNGNYAPIKDIDGAPPGDYLARVKHEYEFSPGDTVSWTMYGSHWLSRLFDGRQALASGKSGGLIDHLIPLVNISDTLLTTPASVAADRTANYFKGLEALGRDYATKFTALGKDEQSLVNRYLIKANDLGLRFDPVKLGADGFSEQAIDAIRSFKKVQDTNHHFENVDLNRTLNHRGWQKYVDQSGDSELVVRPVGHSSLKSSDRIMDGTGALIKPTATQLEELYKAGGTIAELRRPILRDKNLISHILVPQTSEGGYLRKINPYDRTLAYRDGYFAVRYEQPYFITKEIKGADGSVNETAIATAANRKDADGIYSRLTTTDLKGKYNIRGDVKKNGENLDNFKWDLIVNGGRSPQRLRGKRLIDGTEAVSDLNLKHIETPTESLVHSLRSISYRMATRNWIETAKSRWMSQFGHLMLDAQQGKFPEDIRMIGRGTVLPTRGEIADAKTTWRYINSQEAGYVNLLDDSSKRFFSELSDTSGRSNSMRWAEGPLRNASGFNPTQFARKKVFRLTLAANPLRQSIVQFSQVLPTILATNPLGIPHVIARLPLIEAFERGLKAEDMSMWLDKSSKLLTGLSTGQAQQMFEHWKMSGFDAAVNANSVIRDDLVKLVNTTPYQKINKVLSTPLNLAQKFGFQAGESSLMKVMWLSEYDNLLKTKVPIDADKLEHMVAKVRNLTTNMNIAGETPYNSNDLSLLMQFMQAPHKAFSTIMWGHKGLSTSERVRLGSAYILTFGLGATPFSSILSNALPNHKDNPVVQVLEGGLFDMALNGALTNLFHKDVKESFSDSLRLLQLPDVFRFFQNIIGQNLGDAAASSPSLGLVFGQNARVTNLVKEMIRPFSNPEDRTPQQAQTIGVSFLKMFSGMSNFFKAKYIMEHQKIMGSTGNITDPNANDVEALLAAAGFRTYDEVNNQAFSEGTYQMSQQPYQDVSKWLNETSRHLASQDISKEDQNYTIDVMREANRVWGGNPFYMKIIQDSLARNAAKGDSTIFKTIVNLSKFQSESDVNNLIENGPFDDQEKQRLKDIVSQVKGTQ